MSTPRQIKKLDETVVNRIAAGEIIQRPANALKELIENCLDAKATNIQIVVKEGGLKSLQIQDNGTGIRKDDLEIVCERFTTSKLENFEELQSISTFGFRGEALASISHVAQLTIMTKTIDEKCAYKASYSDGKLKAPPVPCAGNQGTLIIMENLFYNIPTRRKALSSASEELSKIMEIVTKYAVHNSLVGFSLKKQGESNTCVRTPHSSTIINNIRLLYGNSVARELIEVNMSDGKFNFKVHALITNPNYSSKRLIFLLFINHRLVESSMMRKMIDDLYSVHLPKKTHPWCYISLEIEPMNVDVNVHPTKHQVKFLHEDSIIEKIKITLDERLLGLNTSRTLYIQSKLPNVNVTKEILKEVLPEFSGSNVTEKTKKPYAHEIIRTSASDQKLDKFNFKSKIKDSVEIIQDNKSNKSDHSEFTQHSCNQRIEEGVEKTNVIVDDFITIENNETCFTLDNNNDTEDIQSKRPVDMELDPADGGITANKALQRVYKHWSNYDKQDKDEISEKDNCVRSVENDSSQQSSEKGESSVQFRSYSVNSFRRDVKLKSILLLRKEIEDNYHAGLREILSKSIFVGCIDTDFALIQSGIHLYICKTKALTEELFYEILLYDFANYGVIKFSEPLPLYDLAMLGLETSEAGWTEKDGNKDELANKVRELLLGKADMMKEYFSIVIDKKGNLKSLPILLDKYYPCEAEIPLFILRLATEVDWDVEQSCFQGVCREIAKFYSRIDPDSERHDWKHVTEHILYSAIKESLLPPKHFAHDSTILELTSLTDLYKVFERC